MKSIQSGLFAVEEQMPCSPRSIQIRRYMLPSTLNRVEPEEAAARILLFSQQLDQWVGVSWSRLVEMMREDFALNQSVQEAHAHNVGEEFRVANAMWKYRLLCVLTLGLYAIFEKKPQAQMREVRADKVPFSAIFLFGPDKVVEGIQELIENGMLRRACEGEGENAFDVFFPTPKLVTRIMKVQGVAA